MKQIFTLLALPFALTLTAQTVSTAENVVLASETYWNGSDMSGGVASGNAFFPNTYDTTFTYWSSGWAVSNRTDSAVVASSVAQLYTASAGSGYQSSNYFVGTNYSMIRLTGNAAGKVVNGMYVNTSAFAYNSMTFGDAFAKQFGGASGNDPDWFKMVVRKYLNGQLGTDSVEFYFADFRFANNAQDYIVRNWTWLNLTTLGNCDSLEIELSSSDVGSLGMNTPAYYCIDNFTTADSPLGITETENATLSTWPNPFSGSITLARKHSTPATVQITDAAGRQVFSATVFAQQEQIDLSFLAPGMYVMRVSEGSEVSVQQLIRN
ncbi:MAG: DUF4465 domain-containing protein [Bacteroidia bacterium]|jgi:hypothetical protein|nr:DUF4465 domain-containing protein [Bacteroidia bacterium]